MAPSGELLWALVRKDNAFIKKQKNVPVFTSEPGNLSGLNSYKYSGLVNPKKVDVKVVKTGEKKDSVMLVQKKIGAKQNKVKGTVVKTGVKKCAKKGTVQLASLLSKAGYRRDVVDLAQAKYVKCLQSLRKPRVTKMTKRRALKSAVKGEEEEVN